MRDCDRYYLEQIALVLTDYANATEKNPDLKRIFDRIPVPGGESIANLAGTARLISMRYPRVRR